MPDTDPSQWTQPWQAKLAPLDVISADGRRLSSVGPWAVRDGGGRLCIEIEGPERLRVVGRVDRVFAAGGDLLAEGVMNPDVPTAGLFPQVELGMTTARNLDEDLLVVDFVSGDISGVLLGTAPAFPDLWFRLVTS